MGRSWLSFLAAFALGSLVGVRYPGWTEASPKRAVRALVATPASPSPFRSVQRTPDPEEFPRLDASELPSLVPWPRLNPSASARTAWRLAEGPAARDGDGRMYVTFTFDDGPLPETTSRVLEILEEHRVHATFFIVGRYLDGEEDRAVRSREVLRRIDREGHLIGNHTHDHKLLTAIPREDAKRQIEEGALSIQRATGKRPTLFRPPYGQLDLWGMAEVASRHLDLVLWNVEAEDMTREDSAAMFKSLRDQLEHHRGGTVLLHDVRRSSIPVLESLLAWLEKHAWDPDHPERPGFSVVDYPTFMRETAASPQPLKPGVEIDTSRAAHTIASPHRSRSLPDDDDDL